MTNKFKQTLGEFQVLSKVGSIIKKQAKEEDSIIIGGQAIRRQLGNVLARPSDDYDLLAKNPRKSAMKLERTLDQMAGFDLFFTRPSEFHPVTHKVISKGQDRMANTKDDIGIADFSPMKPIKTVNISGVRHAALSSVVKDKRKALADQEFEFRHAKDREDIERINLFRRIFGNF